MEKERTKILWTTELAYAMGLIATDGNLSPDGRHIEFASKDKEQIKNFKKCLNLSNAIGTKRSGEGNVSFRIQFGDTNFYRFLESIGITPKKSKTIADLDIPNNFFFDFLRGHFDGDGTFYSYWDPRWRSSFMCYIELTSASKDHVVWLQNRITEFLGIKGRITKSENNSAYRLKYAKTESLKLLRRLYYNDEVICLSRKRGKVEKALKAANMRW